MLTDSFLGRYLLWRTPRWDDFDRFPAEQAGCAGEPVLPEFAGQVLYPTQINMSSAGRFSSMTLANLLEATGTVTFLALWRGQVVFQWRAAGARVGGLGRNLSVTKSIAWAIIARVLSEKAVSTDTPIGDVLPEMADGGAKHLTIDQLMRMSSGIQYSEGLSPWADDARVYHGVNLREAAFRVRICDPVDAYFHYNDWHPLLLAMALERITGRRTAELFSDLWRELGAGLATMTMDHRGPGGLAHMESGFNTSAEGLAAFGRLVLSNGVLHQRQLIPPTWIARLHSTEGSWQTKDAFRYYAKRPWGRPLMTGRYRYKDFWWHYCPDADIHDLFAMGAMGAHLYVSPDTGCVIVRQARAFPKGIWWPPVFRELCERIGRDNVPAAVS